MSNIGAKDAELTNIQTIDNMTFNGLSRNLQGKNKPLYPVKCYCVHA